MVFRAGYSNSMSSPIRILHVDDEPADLEITRILLQNRWKKNLDLFRISDLVLRISTPIY